MSIDYYVAPQGPFKEGDDLLDVMKSIESIDARRRATTAQGVLYSHLIEAETIRLLEMVKRKANETRACTACLDMKEERDKKSGLVCDR